MGLSTHRLLIRSMIVRSSELINRIVGPMRSGDWPKDATDFFNTKHRRPAKDYQYKLRTSHLMFRLLSRDYLHKSRNGGLLTSFKDVKGLSQSLSLGARGMP